MIKFVYGKNLYLINQEFNKIISDFLLVDPSKVNLEMLDGAELSVQKFIQSTTAMPFLAPKRLIVINNLLINGSDSELKNLIADRLAALSENELSQVVFIERGEPDKRLRLFKGLLKYAKTYEAKPYQGGELIRWVQDQFKKERITASSADCQYLIVEVGDNMQKLESEITKIALYTRSQQRQQLQKQDISLLACPEIDPNIFQFIEAISRRDAQTAARLLFEFTQKGENEQKLLGTLAFQLRTLVAVRDALDRGISSRELSQKAKIAPFVITKNTAIAKSRPLKTFIFMYDQLKRTESAIKSGDVAPNMAVDMLVTTLCR